MRGRHALLIASVLVVGGIVLASLAREGPPVVEPRDDRPEPPEVEEPSGPEAGSTRDRLTLDPGEPFRFEAEADEGPLAVNVSGSQVNGGEFGLIARPLGEGEGFAERGQSVETSLRSPASSASFVLLAAAERQVSLTLEADGLVRFGGDEAGTTQRDSGVEMAGRGEQATVATGASDLLVTVENEGAGVVSLVDPEDRERAKIPPAETGWALVEPTGEWSLRCEDACLGEAEVSVLGYQA